MTLKLPSKTSRLKPLTPTPPEEVKSNGDQSPTTALAKLSFSSATGSMGLSISSNDRLKFAPQRSIDEILSSCPKVEKHSGYCSSLSTKRSEEPSINLTSNIGTNVSRIVEKRRADTFNSMFRIDLPIKSYSSYPSSSYKTSNCSINSEDTDLNPTQTKTSRLEKNFNSLPFDSTFSSSCSSSCSSSSYSYSSCSGSAKESSSKKSSSLKYESGNGSTKVTYSSQSNQIKISSTPTQSKRKFESKVKKNTKWYIGLEEDEDEDTCLKKSFSSSSSKSTDQNIEMGFNNKIITSNCQRSDSSSTSGLGSELSDLNTECSSLIGDDECESVTLRRSTAERTFNPSIASHDSAYVSMLMESSSLPYIDPTLDEGNLKEDESLQANTKCLSDDDKRLLTESTGSSSSCNSKDSIRKNDLESSHDSGIQGSISSWSSSLASSIFLTSSTISTSTNQDQELKKHETDETNSSEILRSLYRVNSYPNINDGSALLASEMKTDKNKQTDYTKLVCSCSLQPRHRYSLDLNCLFSVQSNRLALTSCGLSYESCPDFFNTSQPGCNNELTNRRRYCFRCSRYKSLTIDTGPKSQTPPPPSDSSSHRSLFTSQNLIQVS